MYWQLTPVSSGSDVGFGVTYPGAQVAGFGPPGACRMAMPSNESSRPSTDGRERRLYGSATYHLSNTALNNISATLSDGSRLTNS
jgi:hypothetical protein